MFWYNRKPEMCMRCWNYPIIWQKSIETYSQAKKKVVSFPEIRRVKIFLSLTRKKDEYVSESRFLSSKSNKQQQQKNKNQKSKRNHEEKRISPESWSKTFKKIPASRVTIFLATRISRNKSIILLGLSFNNSNHNNWITIFKIIILLSCFISAAGHFILKSQVSSLLIALRNWHLLSICKIAFSIWYTVSGN